MKWPSAADKITRQLHKEGCTWPRREPALPVCLHQRLGISLLPQQHTPASLTEIHTHACAHTHTHTHARRHTEEFSVKQGRRRDVCVYSWCDGGIPWLADKFGMAHGPVFKCISYSVMVSQSVCLSVCLSDCLPSEDTPVCERVCVGGLLPLLGAKNKHTPHKCGATSSYDVKITATQCELLLIWKGTIPMF